LCINGYIIRKRTRFDSRLNDRERHAEWINFPQVLGGKEFLYDGTGTKNMLEWQRSMRVDLLDKLDSSRCKCGIKTYLYDVILANNNKYSADGVEWSSKG